ncbi:MAG: 4'-phosphopantetheinyl transferase superfamily protein [Lachnospiraceae bacterium]|nr:4'-phosphopantetheinyl transferase superfamily protein [Lachnospiraceae bacterium]
MGKISVFVTKVDEAYLDKEFDRLYEILYPARKEAVSKLKNKRVSYVSMTAGLILGRAYEMLYGLPSNEIIIDKGEHGKPYIQGKEELKYNISHSGDYVVLAYTMDKDIASVGIDVEKVKVRDDDMKVANRFFTKEEIDYISDGLECSDVDMRFYKIWTMKEAFLKLTGKGLGLRLDSFSVNPDELSISLTDNDVVGDGNLTKHENCNFGRDINNISYDMKVVDKHIISVCVDSDDDVIYEYAQITLDKPA